VTSFVVPEGVSAARARRRRVRWVLGALVVALLVFSGGRASAAVRRYALVVGDNRGDGGEVELRYAESDAQRIYDVLKDLGGFEPGDMVLLRGEETPRVQSTLIGLNDRIRGTIAQGAEAVLFVYYSGHASADALHLAGTHFDLPQLEQLVRGSAATFRILVVDACRSGALTRVKGGHAAPPFDIRVDEHLAEQGLALLTSSAANEDAQESDALKGSFFTHHFVSALLGAADADGDGRITLEEAYRYAYEATLRSSSETWAGLQHPTFRYELQGTGKLPLTQLPVAAQSRATLVFPAGRTYLVMDRNDHGAVVGEVPDVARSRRMSVRAGHYFVRGRATDALLEGEIDAPGGAEFEVADARLHRIAYARLVRKGGGVQAVAHGPEAGYFFHTPLKNAASLCQGAFAGYAVHLEPLSFGARLAGCHTGFASDMLVASTNELGGELRAAHTWDLPVVGIDLGLSLGGWLFRQSFTTQGVAPPRSTPAGSLTLGLGVHADLGKGYVLLEESALAAYVYAQEQQAGPTSLGPSFAFRQLVGVGKVW
jgi:hypothetical protein